jgi:hypothetical protein
MAEKVILKVVADTKGANDNIDKLNSNLDTTIDKTTDVGEAAKKSKKGFTILKTGVNALGTALKAAGIGLIIAAFLALKDALGRNQKVMNVVSSTMTTISSVFNSVVDVLVDMVSWVSESSDRFNGLSAVLGGMITLTLAPLKLAFYAIKLGVQGLMLAWENSFLGGGDEGKIAQLRADMKGTADDIKEVAVATLEAGKDIYNNFGDAISEIGAASTMVIDGIKKVNLEAIHSASEAATAAANQAKLAVVANKGLIEEYDRQAEQQRQIRDDIGLTAEERKIANDKLGEILEEQSQKMLENADIAINAASKELDLNKENIDLQIAYSEALNERAAIEAQITGFRSEQLVNEQALEQELIDKKLESSDMLLELQRENTILAIEDAIERAAVELEIARQSELDSVAGMENSEGLKAAINKKYNLKKQAQDKVTSDAQRKLGMGDLGAAAGLIGQMGDMQQEGTKGWKTAKIAEARINSFVSAQAAFSSMAAIPFVGTAMGIIAAGIALSQGQKQVEQIKATEIPKMARGGVVGGHGSGTSDSVNAKLSRGEVVINAKSAKMFRGALSGMNVAGGGVGFARGGATTPSEGAGFNGFSNEPLKAFVLTDEMTSSQDRASKIKRRSSI